MDLRRYLAATIIASGIIVAMKAGTHGQNKAPSEPRPACVAISRDGKKVFLGSLGRVIVANSDLEEESSISLSEEHVRDDLFASKLQLSPDGSTLAIVEGHPRAMIHEAVTGRIAVWSIKTGKLLSRLKASRPLTVRDTAFSSDGSFLAVATDKNVMWWSAADGKLVGTLDKATSPVCFRSNDRELQCAFAAERNRIGIWSLKNSEVRVAFELEKGETCVAFAPDGKRLATATGLWSLEGPTARRIYELPRTRLHKEAPVLARFSADGALCAFVSHTEPPEWGGTIVVADGNGASTEATSLRDNQDLKLRFFDCAVNHQEKTLVWIQGFPLADRPAYFIAFPLKDSIKLTRPKSQKP